MTPLGRGLLLGGAALVAAGLGVLWRSERATDESAVATAAPSSPAAGLRWRVGSSQQYDVRVDSAMTIDASRTNAAQKIGVRVNGTLDLLTLEDGRDAANVGMRLSSLQLWLAGKTDAATNEALAVPFRVRFTPAGMPETFEFPAGVSAQNRIILENLVRMFQVTVSAGDEWLAQETNASGAYEAAYRRTSPSRVEKTKRGFVSRPSTPIYAGAGIESKEEFRTGADHDWLTAMTVDETVTTNGQGGPAMKLTNHATLELRPTARVAATAATWRFTAAAAPPAAAAATQPAVPQLSREEAQRQIRAEVTALDAATEGRTVLIHQLRDLLRGDGALPAMLLALMQTEQLTDRTRADLYLVFELTGTGEAQTALTSVIGNPAWSPRDSMRAMVALGGVAKPSDDTVAALWRTAQGPRSTGDGRQLTSTATFALGSLGHTMNVASDPSYSSLRSQLLGGALGAASTEERSNFVRAIGNTRDPSLTGDVVALLDDTAPDVRRAAALALGLLDTNQAAEQLMSHFVHEPSSEIRGAIAESLANWTAPTAPAVATIRGTVSTEPDENARYNMARFLGQNLQQFPESRPILQELLRTEQSRRIRQDVAEALAKPR